ncbi:MAG TPA: ATP-dependent sacrificial sulfur transferase LarE [bacterium]|nr:ATP-dependent sacrificial sulfur transferase LarE [bacterium]
MSQVLEKYAKLQASIAETGSLLVAYSGGLDSTFLLRVAHDILGDKVLAVTARSSTYPEREYNEAAAYAKAIGARHVVITSEELDIPGFSENPKDRCYYCKKELFTKLRAIADEHGIARIADGSNVDDLGDYRPGRTAARECAVRSPLADAGLTKMEIRQLSKQLGLATWDKPSFACLSSRVPYGDRITPDKLRMIDEAEAFLIAAGFRQVRVRHHGDTARIEVPKQDIVRMLDDGMRSRVVEKLKGLGFAYITIDLEGYRTGSMNEVLLRKEKSREMTNGR